MVGRQLNRLYGLVFAAFFITVSAHSATLEEINALLSEEASTFDAFYANKPLQDRIYTMLNEYYGGRLSRGDFDTIISKTKKLSDGIPGFAEKMWRVLPPEERAPEFSIESAVRTSGRNVNVEKFQAFVEDWNANLSNHSDTIPEGKLKDAVADLTKRLADVEAKHAKPISAAKTRKARTVVENARNLDRAEVLNSPQAKAVLATVLKTHLQSEAVQDAFNTGDADLILDEVRRMRTQPATILTDGEEVTLPEGMVGQFRLLVPDPDEMTDKKELEALKTKIDEENRLRFPIADDAAPADIQRLRMARHQHREAEYKKFNSEERLFPIAYQIDPTTKSVIEAGAGAPMRYDFVSIPRKFFGFLDGRWLGECVGANCERFAVSAMDGVQRQHVSRMKKFEGFVQLVPGTFGKDEKIYAGAEFGARILRERAVTHDPETGDRRTTTLFDLWLENYYPKKPKNWTDLIMGTNSAINNAGVQQTVRESAAYSLREPISMNPKEFRHLDPMAADIARVGKEIGDSQSYSDGRLVTDPTVPGQSAMRPLIPVTEEEVIRLAESGSNDKALLQVLQDPRWARHPRSGTWVSGIVSRGKMDKELIEKILPEKHWAFKKESGAWIDQLIERGWDKDIADRILTKEVWSERDGMERWVDRLVTRGNADVNVLRNFLVQERWEAHANMPTWLSAIIGRKDRNANEIIIDNILSKPDWAARPEGGVLAHQLADSGEPRVPRLFLKEEWVNHPKSAALMLKLLSGGFSWSYYNKDDKSEELDPHKLVPRITQLTNQDFTGFNVDTLDSLAEKIFYASQPMPERDSRMNYLEPVAQLFARIAKDVPGGESPLFSLANSPSHNRHRIMMDAFLEWADRPQNTALAINNLGPFLMKGAQVARKDGRDMLNDQWMQLARWSELGGTRETEPEELKRSSSRDWMDAVWQADNYYDSAEKVMDFIQKKGGPGVENYPEGAMMTHISLIGMLKTIAPDTRISYAAARGGMAGMFLSQKFPVSEEKFKLSRRGRDLLTEIGLKNPALAQMTIEALVDLHKKGFEDDGKTRNAVYRVVDEYPEFGYKGFPGTFEEKVHRRYAILAGGDDASAKAMELTEPNPQLFLKSSVPLIRQDAAVAELVKDLEAGSVPLAGAHKERNQRMRDYQKAHAEEFSTLCDEVLKALSED